MNPYTIKTVFDEEIKVGDKIMYIYKAGITHICFGEVLKIEYKDIKWVTGKRPVLHVHKRYDIIDGRSPEKADVKVRLTSPLAFKCNETLPYPPDQSNKNDNP